MRRTTLCFALVGSSHWSIVASFRPDAPASLRPPTALSAIGALVKRAKLAELNREYVHGIDTVPDTVKALYARIQERAPTVDLGQQSPGPLQQALTRRAGTLTVIAEYKRKLSGSSGSGGSGSDSNGYIAKEIFDPEVLSPVFREFGASGIAVLADVRMGGCTYDDLYAVCEEQRRSTRQVPGPVAVINSDVVLDAWQIARTASVAAAAVVLSFDLLVSNSETDTTEKDTEMDTSALVSLMQAAAAVDVEAIVSVSSAAQAQAAIDCGARIISVAVPGMDDKLACIEGLVVPEHHDVCKIAHIFAKPDKQLTEIEEAWAVRDKGFQCAWVGEALYKSGADTTEHPGAIIQAMRNKSSLKFASPKARSGRGEGAREYLGDILM